MADERPKFGLITGDREAFERRLVSLAATGSTEDLAAAVRELKRRASLRVVADEASNTAHDVDDPDGGPDAPTP